MYSCLFALLTNDLLTRLSHFDISVKEFGVLLLFVFPAGSWIQCSRLPLAFPHSNTYGLSRAPWGAPLGGGKEGLSSLCMTTDTQSSHKNFFKSLSASVPTQRVLLFDRCPWMFFSLLLLSFPLPWCVFQKARVRMLSQMKARVAYSSSPVPSCSRGWFYAFSSERTPELP